MVERQLPKLDTRVRFPSLAPHESRRSGLVSRPAASSLGRCPWCRVQRTSTRRAHQHVTPLSWRSTSVDPSARTMRATPYVDMHTPTATSFPSSASARATIVALPGGSKVTLAPFWHWGASLMKTADPAVGIPVTRLLVLASVRTAPAAVDETTCPHTSSGGAALETPASAQAVSAPATASHAATTPAIFRPLPMVQGCFAPGLADARSSWVSPNRCHSAPAPPRRRNPLRVPG